MVKQANKKRKVVDTEVGDWVYLKIRPHRQTSMPSRLHPKLAVRYYGPFIVEQKVGEVAYRLQLPEIARIHPVIHASQLKKVVGDKSVEKELPADLKGEGPFYRPTKKVLDRRQTRRGEEEVPQVLIEWQEGGRDEATWEDSITI